MTGSKRLVVAGAALALVALAATANAQAFECKPTETQAECHTRLKCRADEDLEDCKKRLRNAAGNRSDGGRDRGDDRGDDRGGRGDDRARGDNDRGDDRSDRGRGDNDRGGSRRRGPYDDDRGGSDDGRRGGRDRGRRRGGNRGGRGFEANKTFGLGIELGEPSGINGKYFVKDNAALDFGVGVIYRHYYYGDGLHLYFDYLWHPVSLASNQTFELPFYVGVGARYWNFDYCDRFDVCDYGSALGLRIPLGIAFDFNNAPLDIFLQLVPTIDFVYGDYYDRFRDRNHVGIDGSIGIRFWFK